MIKVYYHLAKINNWKNITKYFFKTLINCGLYDECEEIKVGLVSEKDEFSNKDFDFINNFLKLKIYKVGSLKDFELPTLEILYKDCMYENFKLLYFHTKGASFDLDNWNRNKETIKKQYKKRNYEKFEDVEKAYKYTRYWSNFFLIKNYKKCLNLLDNYDLVCLKKAHNENFIPVNFWWTNSEYIRSLKRPKFEKNRYDAEIWVCKNKEKKIKSFLEKVDEYKKIKFI